MKWHGVDRDIHTSLLEYNFILTHDMPDCKEKDEWFVLYRIGKNAFGWSYIREHELDAIIKGEEWAHQKDIEGFLSFVGSSKTDWLNYNVVTKLSDLISYWGFDNILGTEYDPMNVKAALRLIRRK